MATSAAERQRRSRAHRAGNHSLCDPARCPDAPGAISATCADVTPNAPVTPPVTPPPGEPERLVGLARVVKAGDQRDSLEAIRDALAELLEVEREPKAAAVLSREIRALQGELAALSDGGAKESILDELAKRRTERQRQAAGQ